MKKKILLLIAVILGMGITVAGYRLGYQKHLSRKEQITEKENKGIVKGDWCDEHNLPESQCVICNPDLAGKIIISPESQSLVGIKTEKVKIRTLQTKVLATGKVTYDEKKLARITSRVSGRIEEVFVFSQSKVKTGAPLVSIYAPEYLVTQSEYIMAVKRLKRTEPTNNVAEKTSARTIYESAKQKLSILGIPEKQISRLEETLIPQPYLIIRSPFSGTIVESNVIPGDYIQSETKLYKLANLSVVWVIADVYERDIARINGQLIAEITTTAYPDEIFPGKVVIVGDVLDEKTRTFKVRIEVDNSEGKLKPEMFVSVSIITDKNPALVIPKKAILFDGEGQIVFVSSENNTYLRREVKIGKETDEFVEVLGGLKIGEKIVTEGNFLLKSESLKSQMGAGCAE